MNDFEKAKMREDILKITTGYLTSTVQIFNFTEEVMDVVNKSLEKSELRKSNDWK